MFIKIPKQETSTPVCFQSECRETWTEGKKEVKNRITPPASTCRGDVLEKRGLLKSSQAGRGVLMGKEVVLCVCFQVSLCVRGSRPHR